MKIKLLISLLLPGMVLFAGMSEKNWLENGDLSSFDSKKNLRSWRVESTGISADNVNGVSELTLKPQFKYGKHYVNLSQRIPGITKGHYVLSGEFKGAVHTIYLVVTMPAGHKPANRLVVAKLPGKADAWTSFQMEFDIPADMKVCGINFQPTVSGKNDVITLRKLNLRRTGDVKAAVPAPAKKTAAKTQVKPQAKPQTTVKQGPAVEINGTMVARPAAASNVKWPVHLFNGKDYWYMLIPEWRKMKGLKHEKFIQEAGVRGIGTPWKAVKPYRRTGIREIEIWQGGKNVAKTTKIKFTSDERGTKFYYLSHVNDGDPKTIGWLCGATENFRYLNKGVPFNMDLILPSEKPLEKIVFHTSSDTLPVRDGGVFITSNGKEINGTMTRGNDSLTLQFSDAPEVKEVYFKGMTQLTVYTASSDLLPSEKKLVQNKPFTSGLYHGVLKFKEVGEFELENVDRESIRRFRAKYPNFIPEQQLEISANFFQRRVHKSKEAWENHSAKVAPYDRDRYEAAETLRKYWTYQNDLFGGITILEGGLWTMPYYYEWGAPLTIPEAFNEGARYSSNRHLLTFSRGGSRQYNKPFGFYQTVFGHATHADAKYSEEEAHRLAKIKKNPYHPGEDFGVSASYHKRLLMLAYYAGASLQQFESEPFGYAKRLKDNTWTLTGNGKSLKTVYEWVTRPEAKRGTYYAPILLLNDYFSGNWEWRQKKDAPWNVWYMYPYEDGDYLIRHLLNQLDPPTGDFKTMHINSNGMRNSELGDIYDVYFANAPSGAVTPEELGKYPVALLTGAIRAVPGLTANLQKYVKDGGTLVLNSAQLDLITAGFAGVKTDKTHTVSNNMKILNITLAGAEVLAKDSSGLPLVTRYKNGKGHVILATPYHMLNINDKKQSIPLLRELLLKLQNEVLPVKVKGDILFCFNKMSGNDWKLILINNKGTFKEPMRSKEKILPEYAQKVTFTLPKGSSAKELRLNLPIKVNGEQAEVVVPSGDVAVIELKNIPFADEPVNNAPFNRKPSDPDKKAHSNNPAILIESKAGEGGLHYNTQKQDDAVYLSGDQSGVIFTTPKLQQVPMPEGGYSCFAKPYSDKSDEERQIVISNEYTRIDIVNGHWQLFFYDLKQLQFLKGPKVIPGKWTHVAMTWKDNQAHFYVDGQEIVSEKGPLLFGGRCDGCNVHAKLFHIYAGTFHLWRKNLFKGHIKSIKVFGQAPDAEQIKKYAQEK